MYIDFSGLFHQSSKDRSGQGSMKIPLDNSEWPPEWSVISYKDYPRFKKIPLPDTKPTGDLFELIRARSSRRDFSGAPVSIGLLSAVLKYSCGITRSTQNGESRAQPSGGGRYPIEVYPVVFAGSDEVPSGLYHYGVKRHELDVLWQRAFTKEDIAAFFTYPWAQDATLGLFLTAVFSRNQIKYGERGYRQILIEAGEIVQNIYLVSTALGLQCCAIDGVREQDIEKLLDVDGITESVVTSLVLG